MKFFTAFSERLSRWLDTTEAETFVSPYSGKTFYAGKCYNAQGDLIESSLDSSPYVGEIMLFAGNYIPYSYVACDGQLLPIIGNEALFALIGTLYGGNGASNFAVPDFRGRIPIGAGQGSGLSSRTLAEKSGLPTITLTTGQMPTRSLALVQARTVGTVATSVTEGRVDATKSLSTNGGGQAHNNMPPVCALNYCMSLYGIFPSSS
jgi:microcystin-dependent protein